MARRADRQLRWGRLDHLRRGQADLGEEAKFRAFQIIGLFPQPGAPR